MLGATILGGEFGMLGFGASSESFAQPATPFDCSAKTGSPVCQVIKGFPGGALQTVGRPDAFQVSVPAKWISFEASSPKLRIAAYGTYVYPCREDGVLTGATLECLYVPQLSPSRVSFGVFSVDSPATVESIEQLGDVAQVASAMGASAAEVAGAAEADKGSSPVEQLPGPLYATSSTRNGRVFYDMASPEDPTRSPLPSTYTLTSGVGV
ncbi:hypothetical protein CYMTET_22763 [Cymbomonas tetramitiformis]|uniref:Uncharacterized protein n=1 Tax=Cymbomonas tetramitiformis TaxID=36881 RepID=A0AAE0FZK3_9CHLO|nr:hypothetical protein CYMTET_22763 [Cymbomonas tetramitiformis]